MPAKTIIAKDKPIPGDKLTPEERVINRLHERIEELTKLLRKKTGEAAAAERRAMGAEQKYDELHKTYMSLLKEKHVGTKAELDKLRAAGVL